MTTSSISAVTPLLALQARSRIRDQLGVDLPAHALFASPTVAELAAIVTGTQGPPGEIHRIEPLRQGGPRPVSFAQEQLWFLDQLVPGSPAYNIVDVIALPGGESMRRP